MASTGQMQRAGGHMADGQSVTVHPSVSLSERLADPVALGLAGFALSTLVLSVINVGLVAASALPVVLGLALAYGGITQLFAGMWAFVKRNTFAAVALGSYGGFWISYWLLNTFYLSQIPAQERPSALALFLICWGIFSGYMLLISFRVSVAVVALFATLTAAYLLLGIGAADGSTLIYHLGGAFGIATALIAWYISFALTLNRTTGRTLAPIGRLAGAEGDR
jgi:uncharacterized protein